ncbi:MAG: pyrroline-5-carboxylate reductase [Ruminococcaceae bacterium]|nr:pyrroline-5-carboxylate reductase [Oscillospiraceae bacterium]
MITAGFIGCGNMGGALAKAAAKSIGGKNILLSDFVEEKAENLAEEIFAHAADNKTIAENCKYIFLGVKPQVIFDTIKEITSVLKKRKDRYVVISMAAGISIEAIEKAFGFNAPVIRIMPNTPVAVGKGVILYSCDGEITVKETEEFEEIFKFAGITDKIDEKLIDAASALSGCGPAFVYLFIEALSDGGVLCGLPRDKALLYAAETVKGAAEMVLNSGKHPGELKDNVCSPGGTTIEGVKALEMGAFRATTVNAVSKAYEKTLFLKK